MFALGNVQSGINAGWTSCWRQCRLDWNVAKGSCVVGPHQQCCCSDAAWHILL
jgi:hypothetical protein